MKGLLKHFKANDRQGSFDSGHLARTYNTLAATTDQRFGVGLNSLMLTKEAAFIQILFIKNKLKW